MAKHLEAHGVTAETETRVIEGMSPMETLLSHGAERGADLLVVGAHGHYGFPDLLRGSGTKHLLGHMTVPVLISH
jgi:nucleotide-binding universal stress UspA family protein